MSRKEISKGISISYKKLRVEGWLVISFTNFGLGFNIDKFPFGKRLALTVYLPFVDFHVEVWKKR